MLNLATNEKLLPSTGISFAVVVTIMQGLNIARMTNAVLSQALSIIAIIGFFFTVTISAQLHHPLQQFCPERRIQVQVPKRRGRDRQPHIIERSDVSLP